MAPLEPLFMAFNGPYSQHQQGGDDKNHIADGVPYKHVQRRQKIITVHLRKKLLFHPQ